MSNTEKIDRLLQFILLTAGEEDEYTDRWLSPIHLIKYVYLADLAHARNNNGETYTGLNWKFHHYGPWEVTCYERIEPALLAVDAEKRVFQSKYYEDDRDRWYARNSEIYYMLNNQLPLAITGTISSAVHSHGSDTGGLLHYVYKTLPMITAAPGERLDFSKESVDHEIDANIADQEPTCGLTARQKKLRKIALKKLKVKLRKKLDTRKAESSVKETSVKYMPSRYDDVFFEGLAALDRHAGIPIEPGNYKAIFSDDVWKSKARFDPELS